MVLAVYSNEAYSLMLQYIVLLCTWIVVFVLVCLSYQVLCDCGVSQGFHEDQMVELLWTFGPTLAVMILCVLKVFCNIGLDYYGESGGFMKLIGHQWYWEVSQSSPTSLNSDLPLNYDSLMGDFVKSVDNPIVVSPGKKYQLILTSADVIHSLSLPELGVKMDCCPGRLNSCRLLIEHPGSYMGYCTELCGAGHAYMPVVVECLGF